MFPRWLIRLSITILAVWLVWAVLIRPLVFGTEFWFRQHFWWMYP